MSKHIPETYYRGDKSGWLEMRPGNASAPDHWPKPDKWTETQVAFFAFDGPDRTDLPDGLIPDLFLSYGPGWPDDEVLVTELACGYPTASIELLGFVVGVLKTRPDIQPSGWLEWFDDGCPAWVNELYGE